MTVPRILLCVTLMRPEEKSIYHALMQRGLGVDVLTDSMAMPKDAADTYDMAVIRCVSQRAARERARYLHGMGIKTANTYTAIDVCTDKLTQSLVFSRAGLQTPAFEIGSGFDSVRAEFPRFPRGMVVKPLSSSWGRGIALVKTRNELEAWVAAVESLDASARSFPVLLQEFVNKGDSDIRIIIVGATPVVGFRRISDANWKTNTHTGARIEPFDIHMDVELNAMARAVVAVLGSGIYGLDILQDYSTKRYFVCEVNHNPEFSESSKVHGVDVAGSIADEVIRQLESQDE